MVEPGEMSEVANAIDLQTAPVVLNGLPVSEIQAELDRILRSRVFIHSHRIRRFLQFVVEECLYGRQHRLKEYLIGLEVFNRQDDFDPRVDSIVRVEARRLRTKIEEYYQKEGQDNEVRIELRKGSYVPIFEHRRPGIHGGYSGYPQLARLHSIAIGRFATADGDGQVAADIAQSLSDALLKGGHFKVLADGNGASGSSVDGTNGRSNGGPKPDFILEGRLEDRGDQQELFLQLMNVKDKAYVWSDAGHARNIDHLAGSLNRAMITSVFTPATGRTRTRSSQRESFELYLQGRYQWSAGAPQSFSRSAALFNEAVAIDPNYAAAWAALAEASLLSTFFGFTDPRESVDVVRAAAQKATELNPLLPEAHVAMAAVQSLVDWDWGAGEKSFQRALQLHSADSLAHTGYAIQLACLGMSKPALLEAECALELDPASLSVNFALGWLLSVSRREDEAIAQHTAVSRLAPDFPLSYVGLGWAQLRKRQYEDALTQFLKADDLLENWHMLAACLGHCYAKLNRGPEALNQLAQLTGPRQHQWVSPVDIAAIQVGLDQNEEALANLEKAADVRDCSLPVRLLNPEFDTIRSEPRYQALMERIGLRKPRNSPHQ
jgi:tetratricopeptide (TPR) repeat protein